MQSKELLIYYPEIMACFISLYLESGEFSQQRYQLSGI